MRRFTAIAPYLLLLIAPVITGCDETEIGSTTEYATAGIQENTREARAVLAVANQLDVALLGTAGVGLADRVADNVVAYRLGDDEVSPSEDDERFETLKELDAVPFVGPEQFTALLRFARDNGFIEPPPQPAGSGQVVWASDLGARRHHSQVLGIAADSRGDVVVAGWFDETFRGGLDAEPLATRGRKDGFVAKLAADGAPLWSLGFGTEASNDLAAAVYTDARDEILVVADFSGSDTVADLGCGPVHGVAFTKLDRTGTCLWSRTVPLSLEDLGRHGARNVALAPDGAIALAGFLVEDLEVPTGTLSGGSEAVVLLDAAGVPRASLPLDKDMQEMRVAFGADGDLVVMGSGEVNDFGGGPRGIENDRSLHVARLGSSLEHVWSKTLGEGEETDYLGPRAIAVDDEGAVLIGAELKGSANLGGTTLQSTVGGGTVAIVAKLTADGAHLWSLATKAGSDAHEDVVIDAIVPGEGGALHVASRGDSFWQDPSLMRLEAGRIVWTKHLASVKALAADAEGRLLLGGEIATSALGIPSAGGFLAVLTP
jgi:hypothetical protein